MPRLTRLLALALSVADASGRADSSPTSSGFPGRRPESSAHPIPGRGPHRDEQKKAAKDAEQTGKERPHSQVVAGRIESQHDDCRR